ncbi:hypothetical protein Trydic_g23035 [Trypoxylus dichotomus]
MSVSDSTKWILDSDASSHMDKQQKSSFSDIFNEEFEEDIEATDQKKEKDKETVEQSEGPEQDTTETKNEESEMGIGKRTKISAKLYDYHVYLTFEEATTGENKDRWLEAIEDEKQSLDENDISTLIDTNEVMDKRILIDGCLKPKMMGHIKHDYPIVGNSAMRFMFAIAAERNYELVKFDVKTAFLYGKLTEDVYMNIPEGYSNTNMVCKLNRALYGLKQAPMRWNERFSGFWKEIVLELCLPVPLLATAPYNRSTWYNLHYELPAFLSMELTVFNEVSSDHNPVLLQLGQAVPEDEEPLSHRTVSWPAFTDHLSNSIGPITAVDGPIQLETQIRQVTQRVSDSLKYPRNTSCAVDSIPKDLDT